MKSVLDPRPIGLEARGSWEKSSHLALQEMLDIMKAIYDMMGKYTYPALREEAPREHVESFFQVPGSG